jgi:hypothetical protein
VRALSAPPIMTALVSEATGERVVFDNGVFILSRFADGAAAAEHASYKGVSQVGEYLTDSTIGVREIVIEGAITARGGEDDEAAETLAAARRLLSRVTNPLHRFRVERTRGGKTLCLSCSAAGGVSIERGAEWGRRAQKFLLRALCHSPLWYSPAESVAMYRTYLPALYFPAVLPSVMGTRANTRTVHVNNAGDIAAGAVITVRPAAPLPYLRVECATTREYMLVNTPLPAGSTLTLDTRYGRKSAVLTTGGATASVMEHISPESTFFQLQPGDNIISYDGGSGDDNTEIEVAFSESYLTD